MENEITYENIVSAWEDMQENLISVDEFSDVNRFFNACEAEFNEWLEWMAEYFYTTKKEFLTACEEIDELANYYLTVRDGLMAVYLYPYIQMAMDKWREVYYECPDNQYYCCVCGKPIEYDGVDSVMLLDDKWDQVLDFYNLHQYEKDASRRAQKFYKKCDRRGGLHLKAPKNIHTFVCNDCIEKALGRPIEITDINDSPFNQDYIKTHFETK